MKIKFTAKTKKAEDLFIGWGESQEKEHLPTKIMSFDPCVLEVDHKMNRQQKWLYKRPRTKDILVLSIKQAYQQLVNKEKLSQEDYDVEVLE